MKKTMITALSGLALVVGQMLVGNLLFGVGVFGWQALAQDCGGNVYQSILKQWDKRFGGTGYDVVESLQQTSDGGYILGGGSYSPADGDRSEGSRGAGDCWIVKVDASGTKQWDKRFGGTNTDWVQSIQQTSDGGYILGGGSSSPADGDKSEGTRGFEDFWIVKVDASGTKQWDKRFGGTNDDWAESVQQTSDGGYILGGYSYSPAGGDKSEGSRGGSDDWIVKVDASGNKQWDKRFGGTNYDWAVSVQQTSDGGYILGGGSYSPADGDKSEGTRGERDFWTVKMDASGNKQWDKRFGGTSNDSAEVVQQTSDGGYILGGYSYSPADGDRSEGSRGGSDYWIVKVDASGIKQWDKRFGGTSNDLLNSLQQTSDGGYILGGYSYSPADGDRSEGSRGGSDYWIVKVDASGIKQWDKRFGGSLDENSYSRVSLQKTSDGGYILGGGSSSPADGDKSEGTRGDLDYWIVKVFPDTLWCSASVTGGDWRWLNWFGYFANMHNGWINHLEHGWMNAAGSSLNSVWFYSSSLGWTWTSQTTYPYLFQASTGHWLWYLKNANKAPNRWFVDMTTGGWTQH